MSVFDVRTEGTFEVDIIIFSEQEKDGINIASELRLDNCYDHFVNIVEGYNGDYVRIESKEHAMNLIKALNKAIELGWLK